MHPLHGDFNTKGLGYSCPRIGGDVHQCVFAAVLTSFSLISSGIIATSNDIAIICRFSVFPSSNQQTWYVAHAKIRAPVTTPGGIPGTRIFAGAVYQAPA